MNFLKLGILVFSVGSLRAAPATIGVLTHEHLEQFKQISKEAVRTEPWYVYAASPEEMDEWSDEVWADMIEQQVVLGAWHEQELAGILAAAISHGKGYDAHIACLRSFFVRPEHRGTGLGKQLLARMIDRLATQNAITDIMLWVSVTQQAAIQLYTRMGFEIIGLHKAAVVKDGETRSHYIMEKVISSDQKN